MTNESDILKARNWLYLKLYRKCESNDIWKSQLDWYHNVLRELVKPWVTSNADIVFVFFGIYGPEKYDVEPVEYEKRINPQPEGIFNYIRLRAYVPENKDSVKKALVDAIEAHGGLVWEHEVLKYQVRDDLGNRYGRLNDGSIDTHRTVMFIRYWDAACRYILEILTSPGNWDSNVDVWGIPHLVNNSLGAWLRVSDARCPSCSASMYMATWARIPRERLPQLATFANAPICLFACPQCLSAILAPENI
jgi:hypothetical protein